ncbi:SseB family protein [Lacisediminihabitans sp. H27-G8]|uniref:SseB family protein n=1 Tax=Lacisediminihabitans sp. H27-G8 TaxID=3111909 RepID=UPI0038FCA708
MPWEGRRFEHGASSDDDGSAPAALSLALAQFAAGEIGSAGVVDAVRGSRLLIPLVAQLGESAIGDHEHPVDKSAELSIVTVAGPDGRNVMPVFSSVEAMRRWKPLARPVPADAVRVALAAASEGTELVVLDPTSPTEFVIRRPALWAIAQSQPWSPSHLDAGVLDEFRLSIEREPAVASLSLEPGDPDARLAGPELVVNLALVPGLDRVELDAVLARLQARWSASEAIAAGVDSLAVRLGTAGA